MKVGEATPGTLDEAGDDGRVNSSQDPDFGLTLDEYRELMSVGPGVHYVCEAHGDFAALFIAPGITAQFGYDPEDFTSDPGFWASHIHPDDQARVFRDLGIIFAQDFHQHEYRFLHKDGEYRWVSDELRLLRDGSGEPAKIVGQWVDISPRIQERTAAASFERRFYTLAEGAIEGIMVHRDFKPLFANQALADIYGYTIDEIMAMDSLLELIAPHDRKRLAGYNEARARGEDPPLDYEQQSLHKDGTIIWLRNMARRIDWDGQTAVQSVVVDITKQKLLEIELRDNEARLYESEARLRTILDNAPIAIYMKDTEGRYVFSNRRNGEWYGVDSAEAIGRGTEDYFPPDYAKMAVARDRKVIETREPLKHETEISKRDGGMQHCLIHRIPMIDAEDNLIGVLGMNLDITESKRAETELREAENRVRDFAEATSDWFWETNAEHCVTHLSSTSGSWDGTLTQNRIGKSRFDFEAFDGEPGKWRQHRRDLAARRPFRNFRYKRPTPEGGILHAGISGRPFFDNDGTFLGYRGAGMDVTAEVEARNQFVDAIESMADGVIVFDAEERLVAFNQRYREVYGEIASLLETGASFEFLIRAAAKRGMVAEAVGREEEWVEQRLHSFRQNQTLFEQQIENGRWMQIAERKTPNGFTVSVRTEITELKQSEVLLYDAIEAMPEGFALYDADERLIICNQPYRDSLPRIAALGLLKPGITLEELVRAGIEQGFTPSAYATAEEYLTSRLESFRHPEGPYEYVTTNGQWIRFEEKKTSNGGTVAIRTDITESKQLEEQVRRSQKMEAVGQLTGGVAHDFNNMLTAIIGNLELIKDRGVKDEHNRKSIDIALRASFRGAELTHRLLAFSRQQDLDTKVTQINEILPQFSQLAQRTISEDITIGMKLAANLWPAKVDVGELENALLNLAINARDAMPNGGHLTIETANHVLEEEGKAIGEDLAPGPYVTIAVSDSGTGMPAEVRERVFEPFFTTKEVGKGSGLGLSMVFGFAKQSGGEVTIYSEEGAGTTVRIYLPKAEEPEGSEAITEESEQHRPAGEETILVVEDDENVREYLMTVLEDLGYAVLQAEDGPAALDVMAAAGVIDLLLTDVILPRGMNGRDIAKAFNERYPAAGVLFSSGHAQDILSHRGELEDGVELMNKPYRPSVLAQRVRQVLDGRK